MFLEGHLWGCTPPSATLMVTMVHLPMPSRRVAAAVLRGPALPKDPRELLLLEGVDPPKASVSIVAVGGRASLVRVGAAFLYKRVIFLSCKQQAEHLQQLSREEDPLLVQEEDPLLAQEQDLPLVDEHILLV